MFIFHPYSIHTAGMMISNDFSELVQVPRFVLQEDANLVIYDLFDEVKWTSDTAKECGDASSLQLRFENDGNLVLYCGEEVLWQTQTDAAVPICRVVAMQNDGALAMYNVGISRAFWSSTKSIPLGFGPSNLTSPHSLTVGMRLVQSSWKQFEFSLEGGKPTLKEWQGSTLWTSDEGCEASESTAHLRMQEDGNLVSRCSCESFLSISFQTNQFDQFGSLVQRFLISNFPHWDAGDLRNS